MDRRVFVISDLHLGGSGADPPEMAGNNFSTAIFHSQNELVGFIDWLRQMALSINEEVHLVINGDFVDFLIEDRVSGEFMGSSPWTSDQHEAIRKLQRMADTSTDEHGQSIFFELSRFVQAGGHLAILLGNHDVELSLPLVRTHLVSLLRGPSSRLTFLYDGEAYSIGRLLIEHGNRYDAWNRLDYDSLRRERSLLSRGIVLQSESPDKAFKPPPGTLLVTSFINRIKHRYPFVNLLKPETPLVIPLLLALEPQCRASLDDLVKLAAISFKRGSDWGMQKRLIPQRKGSLSASGDRRPVPDSLGSLLRNQFGESAEEFGAPASPREGELSATSMEALWRRLTSLATFNLTSDESPSNLVMNERRVRQLRLALRYLNRNDLSFDVASELPEFLDAAHALTDENENRSQNFDVVIFGHTHLPKKIELGKEGKLYLNTGTWCEMLRLPAGALQDGSEGVKSLQKFLEAMVSGRFDEFTFKLLCYAEILVRDSGKVQEANLLQYCGPGRERTPV